MQGSVNSSRMFSSRSLMMDRTIGGFALGNDWETGQRRDAPMLLELISRREQQEQDGECEDFLGAWLAERLKGEEEELSVLSLLASGKQTALEAPSLNALSYDELREVLTSTNLPDVLGIEPGQRVAVCVQNSSHLAALLLTIIQAGCCVCPLDPASSEQELSRDLAQLHVQALVVDSPSGVGREAARSLGLACGLLVPEPRCSGRFSLLALEKLEKDSDSSNGSGVGIGAGTGEAPQKKSGSPSPKAAQLAMKRGLPGQGRTVLVLPTSGTTGRKKSVPYDLATIAVSAGCIISSWDLTQEDVCLTMMPLTHVGGICRNLFAVLLSGGCLVCYPAFDPTSFWPAVEEGRITWYYASPTMHRSILEEGRKRPPRPLALRMVCNAAGGLPPTLAQELRARFGCPILPSYGMTECMPISSPPTDFEELVPKTSGLPCGPEVAIMDNNGEKLGDGEVGNIAVRGPPLMPGYEELEENENCWLPGGWFLTGDLGVLKDGWLQVTGRTKEVIKRGGETLAPVQVEEVVLRRLSTVFVEVAAFAIKDIEMGENVALAVVAQPGVPRPGLPQLHAMLRGVLRPQLWPQSLVYCDPVHGGLPKTSTGKIRRALLTQACSGISISQQMPWRERVFHTLPGQPLKVLRPVMSCAAEGDLGLPAISPAEEALRCEKISKTRYSRINDGRLHVVYLLGHLSTQQILDSLAGLDDFDKPDAVVCLAKGVDFPKVLPLPSPSDFLFQREGYQPPTTEAEKTVCRIWAEVLQCDQALLSVTTNFFEAGGTSLQVGRVASELRKRCSRMVPTHMLFSHPCLKDLAHLLEKTQLTEDLASHETSRSRGADEASKALLPGPTQASRLSSTNPVVLLIQLFIPILIKASEQVFVLCCFCYGVRRATRYLQYEDEHWQTLSDVIQVGSQMRVEYLMGLLFAWVGNDILLPLCAILLKWLLVGCVSQGHYPLWGFFYVRWWIALQIIDQFQCGCFDWSMGTRRMYLRLLGASVSGSAKITFLSGQGQSRSFLEGDLLTIREGALLDGVLIKCASLDGNTGELVLLPVVIEENASVGLKTIVAPGTRVPANASLGPLSSTHELQDANENHRRFNRLLRSDPHVLLRVLIGYPLKGLCCLVQVLPWLYMLSIFAAFSSWEREDHLWVHAALVQMTQPSRIKYYLLAHLVKDLSPVIYVLMLVLMKWLVVGRFRAGSYTGSEWEKFRYWFMALLLNGRQLSSFASLVGPHYVIMTLYYRAMGATTGQRIFWPGQPLDIIEYDLLEVGDDVTFGSRTVIQCSNLMGAQKVRILDGAMVADNCFVQAGTVLAEGAMLGSGSMSTTIYPAGSVSIGNINGTAVVLRSGDDTAELQDSEDIEATGELDRFLRPFGRVFYIGAGACGSCSATPYCVFGWPFIFMINLLTRSLWLPFGNAYRWLSLLLVRRHFGEVWGVTGHGYGLVPILLAASIAVTLAVQIAAVLVDVALKWLLIGKSGPGECSWETSSYCQRWKFLVAVRSVIHHGSELSMYGGSWWLVLYYRMLGADIGKNVCLYPWGASPMMTEPDLVSIGSGSCIESAHLVAHTNALGLFRLDTLRIGNYCTLRDNSRVMSGGQMRDGATLLEHSLVMPGDVMLEGSWWQGWPNRWQGTDDPGKEPDFGA